MSDFQKMLSEAIRNASDFRPVIIESPFKASLIYTEEDHIAYLNRVIRFCVFNNLTPYASHKMIPGGLDDSIPKERILGIVAGLGMVESLLKLGAPAIYAMDYGMSSGMGSSKANRYDIQKTPLLYLLIGKNEKPEEPFVYKINEQGLKEPTQIL